MIATRGFWCLGFRIYWARCKLHSTRSYRRLLSLTHRPGNMTWDRWSYTWRAWKVLLGPRRIRARVFHGEDSELLFELVTREKPTLGARWSMRSDLCCASHMTDGRGSKVLGNSKSELQTMKIIENLSHHWNLFTLTKRIERVVGFEILCELGRVGERHSAILRGLSFSAFVLFFLIDLSCCWRKYWDALNGVNWFILGIFPNFHHS